MNKQQLKIDYIEQKNYYKIVYRKIKVRIYQIYFGRWTLSQLIQD